jgi:hypothetical protein
LLAAAPLPRPRDAEPVADGRGGIFILLWVVEMPSDVILVVRWVKLTRLVFVVGDEAK